MLLVKIITLLQMRTWSRIKGKMTQWPKMTPENGCLVENVAARLPEHPCWHLQEDSHRWHLSPLKFDASGPNHADC